MFGASSLANIKGVFKLTDCTLSQSSLLVESMFSKSAVPALLTNMSIVPKTLKPYQQLCLLHFPEKVCFYD